MAIELVSTIINSSVFAALFLYLFMFLLKDSKEREKKFNHTVDTLLESLKSMKLIDEKCEEINDVVIDIRAALGDVAKFMRGEQL